MKQAWQTGLMVMLMLVLSACHLIPHTKSILPTEEDKRTSLINTPPKISTIDWKAVITPLIDELLETMVVSDNNTMLISDINNNSNQYVSSTTLNNIIVNTFRQQSIFNVIDPNTIIETKLHLGITNDDGLVSRSKMIGLARQVKADYVLFTTIKTVPELPNEQANVEMELLLTKTGEIVWQFSSDQLVNDQNIK
ncbi:hypothetical protein DES39_0950 [Orbus hercynius]|uniref:Penicillin-binding protein activator LpoB n=1 Tax=Orbus hercynius TaxID=593135 RepID=A0A495RK26_9GAMM|nr:hypothetical protein [Orbus hercynius]RKS87709.1 hypothetical protein DES39_0950 [Orbus hercynius]